MFFDARKVPDQTLIESDICIIGAGAAGITLAKEFIGQPFLVCLLESGGLDPDQETQSLYEGESVGLDYSLTKTRKRYFGGSTNCWNGMCRPLDENIFRYRPWVPDSGWPLSRSELNPYYQRAQAFFELGDFNYDPPYWVKKFKASQFQELPFSGNRAVSRLYQCSKPPTRFGKTYRKDIMQAEKISVYLYANVINIESAENEKRVTRAEIATLEGNRFGVSAKLFILAAGGIENARLLLISNKNGQTAGLGNQNDLVGRYFMEHPKFKVSGMIATLKNSPEFSKFGAYSKMYKKRWLRMAVAEKVQERERLLSYSAFIKNKKGIDPFQQNLADIMYDLDTDDPVDSGENPPENPAVSFRLASEVEQSPNPNSRITLSHSRDRLGINRVRLDWRLTSYDLDSLGRSIRIIGEEFGKAGLGRVQQLIDGQTRLDGFPSMDPVCHHMGATRMSDSPRKGVVDRNCRVHGTENLYIAGSSVFPVGGSSNPTLTIAALAIRLADHIKKSMAP